MNKKELKAVTDRFRANAEAAEASGRGESAHIWRLALVEILSAEADSLVATYNRALKRRARLTHA